jgi:hypothetical protein
MDATRPEWKVAASLPTLPTLPLRSDTQSSATLTTSPNPATADITDDTPGVNANLVPLRFGPEPLNGDGDADSLSFSRLPPTTPPPTPPTPRAAAVAATPMREFLRSSDAPPAELRRRVACDGESAPLLVGDASCLGENRCTPEDGDTKSPPLVALFRRLDSIVDAARRFSDCGQREARCQQQRHRRRQSIAISRTPPGDNIESDINSRHRRGHDTSQRATTRDQRQTRATDTNIEA